MQNKNSLLDLFNLILLSLSIFVLLYYKPKLICVDLVLIIIVQIQKCSPSCKEGTQFSWKVNKCVGLFNCRFDLRAKLWPHHIIRSGRIGHEVNFKRSLTGLNSEFSFSKARRTQSALLFTHSWRENNWIPKDISAIWNAISLVQDLNTCRRVHFLQR